MIFIKDNVDENYFGIRIHKNHLFYSNNFRENQFPARIF